MATTSSSEHRDNIPQKQSAMAKMDPIRIEHLAYSLERLLKGCLLIRLMDDNILGDIQVEKHFGII